MKREWSNLRMVNYQWLITKPRRGEIFVVEKSKNHRLKNPEGVTCYLEGVKDG